MTALLAALTLALVLPLSAAPSSSSTTYPISNRAPEPGEVGYRPADGGDAVMNPPSLVWLHEKPAKTYDVQWSPSPSFTSGITTITDLLFNTYTHNKRLPPGAYHWRYRYTSTNGEASGWSATRKFTVTSRSIDFPMPSRIEQRQRVPQDHPRLFMRPENLPRMRALVATSDKPAGKAFAALRKEADRLLESPLIPEPTVRGTIRDPQTRDSWWPNRTTTEKACKEAEILAFVWLMTGERQYGDAARKYILHLAGWDPDGPTNFRLNCEAAKPILYRLPRAYDWAYGTLSEPERDVVRKVMVRRGIDAWKSSEIGEGTGHINRPYTSHGNRIFHKLGECAIAFLGEVPEAETWLDYAVNKFYACYPVWSDDDGGWHEGVSYWNGYMSKIVVWLQVAQTALQIDGFKKPFFASVGDFPLYVAPLGSPNQGFADLSFSPPRGAGFVEYFARAMGQRPEGTNAPYWVWRNESLGGGGQEPIFEFLYAASLPPLPAPRMPADLPPSKLFRGIGVASLHLTLTNAAEDVHVLFKASPFGSQSHGHNPQNSFLLNAYGEQLLTTCVYRDWHGSPFHYKWAHSTVAQNAVLVDGAGQVMHSAGSTGEILDFKSGKDMDYALGDAVDSYGGRLLKANRTIALLKSGFVIIYDDLQATNEVRFQFMSHGLSSFECDDAAQRLRLVRPKAAAVVQYLGAQPLSFRQWDGFEPRPEREFPNQWHVEASTPGKQRSLHLITVIAPEKTGAPRHWTAQRLETGTAAGVKITTGNETFTVAFRKSGTSTPARLSGHALTTPATFLRD